MTYVKYVIPFLFVSSSLFSLTSEWIHDGNQNWATATPANWSAGVPNAVDDVAEFLGAITAARLISLSQATTVGTLNFNNNNAYTIQSNTLKFQTSTGDAQINNTTGTGHHVITSNVSLSSPLIVTQNVAAGQVTISGVISGAQPITINGTGNVVFDGATANTYTGLTTINITGGNTLALNKTGGIALPGDALILDGGLGNVVGNQISSSSTVTINGAGASFSLNGGASETIGHLNHQEGTLNIPAATTLTLASNTTALTLGHNVINNEDLTLSGTGAIVMSPIAGSITGLGGVINLGTQLHEVNIPAGVNALFCTNEFSGTGGLVKTGPRLFRFANNPVSNTYSGLTIINEGTFELLRPGQISIPGDIFINGGTLSLLTAEQIADTSTMILQAGAFNMAGFNETIDRLDFTGGVVSGFTGTLALQSPSTALQMSGGTSLIGGGTVDITNATGGVVFDPSVNGTATIENMNLVAGAHPFDIGNGSANPDMDIIGVISGNGGITKNGGGQFRLRGGAANTYVGVTTVNAGELILDKNAGVHAMANDVVMNGGVLFMLNSNQIASTATLTMNNGSSFFNGNDQTLHALNYFGGSVVQSGGSLTLDSGLSPLTMRNTALNGPIILSNPGTIMFDPINNGTATIDGTLNLSSHNIPFNIGNGSATEDMVIRSIISNGGVFKTGGGTLVLLGANNYGVGTTVIQGILQGNTTSFPPITTTITAPGTLVFDQTFDGTFLGILGGTGDMIKQGGATLKFSTPQIVGGTTTVAEGTLLVNSTFGGAGALNVNSGAILGGIGTITKNVTVSGTLSPGDNGIGTLTLNGIQTLAPGSILDIELTPTTNDFVNITGTINIHPDSTFDFFPQPATYVEPLNYTVVQTTGGRTGTFDHARDPFPLFLGNLSYDANNVYLSISLLPVSDLQGLSRNAQKVAHCLDGLNPLSGSDLYNVINSLRFVTTIESIEKSLLNMQPSLFTSLAVVKQESTLYMHNALFNRLESRTRSCMKEKMGYRYWAAPLIGVAQENNHGKEAGYNALTPGIAVGVDGWLFPDFQIGGSLGYTNSDIHWKKKRGSGRIHGIYGAAYSRLGSQVGFLESTVILGYNRYSTQREIHIGGLIPLDRSAKESHYGLEASGHVKGAFQLPVNKTQLGPYASLDYQYQYEDSFDEHGAKSLNLDVSSKHANFMQSEIGMDAAHCLHLAQKTLTPYLQACGIWEKRFNGGKEESSFGGCPINVYGYYRSRFLVGAGGGFDVKWELKTAPRASFNYKGKYGLGYQDHSFNLILIY